MHVVELGGDQCGEVLPQREGSKGKVSLSTQQGSQDREQQTPLTSMLPVASNEGRVRGERVPGERVSLGACAGWVGAGQFLCRAGVLHHLGRIVLLQDRKPKYVAMLPHSLVHACQQWVGLLRLLLLREKRREVQPQRRGQAGSAGRNAGCFHVALVSMHAMRVRVLATNSGEWAIGECRAADVGVAGGMPTVLLAVVRGWADQERRSIG